MLKNITNGIFWHMNHWYSNFNRPWIIGGSELKVAGVVHWNSILFFRLTTISLKRRACAPLPFCTRSNVNVIRLLRPSRWIQKHEIKLQVFSFVSSASCWLDHLSMTSTHMCLNSTWKHMTSLPGHYIQACTNIGGWQNIYKTIPVSLWLPPLVVWLAYFRRHWSNAVSVSINTHTSFL